MDVHILCLLIVTLTGGVRAAAPFITTSARDGILVIPEDKEINSTLYTITINDIDHGDKLRIRPVDTLTDSMVETVYSPDQLITPPQNINVTVKRHFDRDSPSPSVYLLRFQVSDQTNNAVFRTVSVYPSDVNDNPPVFHTGQYSWEVPEDAQVSNTTFNQIQATDIDNGNNGTVEYEMQPTTQSQSVVAEYNSTFKIDKASGVVILIKPLDYEKNSYYQFTVIAKDKGLPPLNSSMVFIIRVLDVQDTPPFFTGIPYRTMLVESERIGIPLLTLTAYDGDHGIPNEIAYRIIGGPCSDMFTVDINGIITSAKHVDRDAGIAKDHGGICQLTVEASEKGLHPTDQHSRTMTNVAITVLDVNDNSPTFSGANFTTQVEENAPFGSTFILPNFSVTDIDQGENGTMRLYITDDIGHPMTDFEVLPSFVVGSAPLNIRVKNSAILDRESVSFFRLTVVARDSGVPVRSSSVTVTVVVLDSNDNAPQFNAMTYQAKLSENAAIGTSVLTVSAIDRDEGRNSAIMYTLDNERDFQIDHTTGVITVARRLDFNTKSIYHFRVIASDNPNDPRHRQSSYADVTIHSEAAHNNFPVMFPHQSQPHEVHNEIRVGSVLLTVSVSDRFCPSETMLTPNSDQPVFSAVSTNTFGEKRVNTSLRSFSRSNPSLEIDLSIGCD